MTVVVGTLFLWLTLFVVAPVWAQTKITIAHAAISPRIVPLVLAQEQGIFAKHGLETRLVLIKGAPILVASLLTGDIDVGYTGGTSVLGAAAQGSYLKILASISSKLTHTMIASPNFKTAEQLRGKRFGIQSMGGSTWMHTILGLEHVGLDVKRDTIKIDHYRNRISEGLPTICVRHKRESNMFGPPPVTVRGKDAKKVAAVKNDE